MGVTSYYLCHILLVRASCSFHSAVRGRKLYTGVWLIEGHLTLYLPRKVCAQSNFGRSSDQSGFQVLKEQGLVECAVAAISCKPTWLNGYPVFKLQTWCQIKLGESQFFHGLTVQLYLSMPQFLPLQNEDDSTPPHQGSWWGLRRHHLKWILIYSKCSGSIRHYFLFLLSLWMIILHLSFMNLSKSILKPTYCSFFF